MIEAEAAGAAAPLKRHNSQVTQEGRWRFSVCQVRYSGAFSSRDEENPGIQVGG